jgi:hypothetical protein
MVKGVVRPNNPQTTSGKSLKGGIDQEGTISAGGFLQNHPDMEKTASTHGEEEIVILGSEILEMVLRGGMMTQRIILNIRNLTFERN